VVQTRGFDKVTEDVRHLLSSRLGDRVMLRTYGGGVHHRLQSPNDGTMRTLVKHEIEEALRTFLPDLRLVTPVSVTGREHELRIAFEYKADPRDVVRRVELELP
jgi:phage baseplate assembly protein W